MSEAVHTLMLLANGFAPDPRVHKEARTLTAAGYAVTIVCLDREQSRPREQQIDRIRVLRVRAGRVVPGRAASVGPALTGYYAKAVARVLALHRRTRFALIHCHDMDTVLLGLALRPLLRAPVLYDMHDLYSSFFAQRSAERVVQALDRAVYAAVDGQIVVNRSFETLPGINRDKTAVVMNVPDVAGAQLCAETGEGLFYAGNLDANRDMRYALPALAQSGLRVVFAGDGPLMPAYRGAAEAGRVELLGRIPPAEVMERTARCKAVLALYDTRFRNNRFASPNKLFDAMKFGKPAIVSDDTVMAEIVREEQCGLVVPYGDATALSRALGTLADDASYARLCRNAHAAFVARYNWEVMAPRLTGMYARLIGGGGRVNS